jgi:NitT/TauT family transport system substrate-binding protein
MRSKLIAFSGMAAALAAVLVTTVRPSQSQPAAVIVAQNQATTAQEPKQKLLVRFTWKVKGEYAPLYVALDKGYYSAEGLDVQFAEGSGSETVVKLIGVGTDKIGYGSATVIAEAVNYGLGVEVIAIYQPSVPIALVSFPDIPLKTPKDLEGRKLGISLGEAFGNMLEPFSKFNKIDLSKVTTVQMENSARNAQFLARKIDVTSVFLNNELPLFENKIGVKFNVLKIADFGLNLLGASFFVNNTFAKNNPELLRKLLRATTKGYLDAKSNPEGATDIMEKYMKVKIDRGVLKQQVNATLDATPISASTPLGWQNDADWKVNLDLLKSTNAIQVIKDMPFYYTNEYLR